MKSRVMVEEEASTREERVDMEADSTSTMTMPRMREGRVDSMRGITASKPSAATSTL